MSPPKRPSVTRRGFLAALAATSAAVGAFNLAAGVASASPSSGAPIGSTVRAPSQRADDEVLDNFMLYWLTNSATSAARLYWENGGPSVLSSTPWKTTEIALPVAITVFPEDVYRAPESWARRAYPNLIYFQEVDRGGHFAAWEQPRLFSEELRAAFRSLR